MAWLDPMMHLSSQASGFVALEPPATRSQHSAWATMA